MISTTKLNLLYMDALDRFKRRIEEERVSLALEGDESIPSDRHYELIRDVADESVPETDKGRLQIRPYKDKGGSERTAVDIVATNVQVLDKKQSDETKEDEERDSFDIPSV